MFLLKYNVLLFVDISVHVVKEHAYCSGHRVALGRDKVHGRGVSSVEQCAILASADSRCDGSRSFDYSLYYKDGQCKCPTTNNCGTGTANSWWTIYRYENDVKGKPFFY